MHRLLELVRPKASRASAVAVCLLLLLSVASCGKRPRTAKRPALPPPGSPPTTQVVDLTTPTPSRVVDTTATAPQLSDVERKAAARAAFSEGVELQERNDCPRALPRFESAERLYPAPTHLL